jgi:S-layer homology domain
MKRIVLPAAALFVLGAALPLLGEDVGAPGYVVGPNTFGPESRSLAPTYGTADLTKLNLASMGFSPLDDGQWGTYGSTGFSIRSGGNNSGQCANVHLPSGALLEGITTYTVDSDAVKDVSYILFEWDMNTSTSTNPFEFSTSGSPGLERVFHAIDPPVQISNDNTAYTLCTFHGVVGVANQNAGATFWYRLQVGPAPGTATFNDVPTSHPFFQFVEALAAAGITGGCGGGNYCPDNPVTRGQMAVFLSKALGLHFPN